MNLSSKQNIIWDWNGTLLNDVSICLKAVNILLEERNLPLIDEKQYRESFMFPVKQYYELLGFDFAKEAFEIPAKQYIEHYDQFLAEAQLTPGIIETLDTFAQDQKNQFVLSAREHQTLSENLEIFGIKQYLKDFSGLSDHYAREKISSGKQLMKKWNLNKADTIMIGDTIHDYEVAVELDIDIILLSSGHQSENRLKETGAIVVRSPQEFLS